MRAGLIGRLEHLIANDLGKRGIQPLVRHGSLHKASADLFKANHIAIATGLFIRGADRMETDGPAGALAIAKACLTLNKSVTIITDEYFPADVLPACANTAGLPNQDCLSFFQFPSLLPERSHSTWSDFAEQTIASFGWDHLLAIEKAGPAADGVHYNMLGESISARTCPVESLFDWGMSAGLPTTGIGDGGNEIGMGNVADVVRQQVQGGERIACVTRTSTLVTCGISNWGGHALACALALKAVESGISPSLCATMVGNTDVEWNVLSQMKELGLVDGVRRSPGMSVDGVEFAEYSKTLKDCWNLLPAP